MRGTLHLSDPNSLVWRDQAPTLGPTLRSNADRQRDVHLMTFTKVTDLDHSPPGPATSASVHSTLDAGDSARIKTHNGITHVALSGELDLSSVPLIEKAVAPKQSDGDPATNIMIDLREVTFVDCSAIGALVAANNHTRSKHGQLIIIGVANKIRRVFELTGTQYLLDSRDAADVVAEFNGSRSRPLPEHGRVAT